MSLLQIASHVIDVYLYISKPYCLILHHNCVWISLVPLCIWNLLCEKELKNTDFRMKVATKYKQFCNNLYIIEDTNEPQTQLCEHYLANVEKQDTYHVLFCWCLFLCVRDRSLGIIISNENTGRTVGWLDATNCLNARHLWEDGEIKLWNDINLMVSKYLCFLLFSSWENIFPVWHKPSTVYHCPEKLSHYIWLKIGFRVFDALCRIKSHRDYLITIRMVVYLIKCAEKHVRSGF